MPAVLPRLLRAGALITALAAGFAGPAAAQIRGSRQVVVQPSYGWWFSGGANGVILNDVLDGASLTKWKFGSDPLWQLRGTLEKAIDQSSTIGLSAGYGVVDVTLEPYGARPIGGNAPALSACATTGCLAQTELWTAMGQFRSGGGQRGFHTIFVLAGGATAFRNFTVKATGDSIPGFEKMRTDLSGSLGGGVAYTLSQGLVVELIQDFGIGWHSKEGLADGDGRTYRSRTTRAGLRFHFGGGR